MGCSQVRHTTIYPKVPALTASMEEQQERLLQSKRNKLLREERHQGVLNSGRESHIQTAQEANISSLILRLTNIGEKMEGIPQVISNVQ